MDADPELRETGTMVTGFQLIDPDGGGAVGGTEEVSAPSGEGTSPIERHEAHEAPRMALHGRGVGLAGGARMSGRRNGAPKRGAKTGGKSAAQAGGGALILDVQGPGHPPPPGARSGAWAKPPVPRSHPGTPSSGRRKPTPSATMPNSKSARPSQMSTATRRLAGPGTRRGVMAES